ncbi:fumarate hydratase, class II [Ardenticatena maritima]|uniref:Fumarate hydratase class II n=1 Tax=Ardenticatena maritima TaxID=872965 RepID=A0A0M8K7V0_9CHLR|nr:class II fumarate hydratase [Ardenticatena maritima]KPL86461.1 aspartate ammonia-lyase [Ardenticatena maritima]GAP62249.1 fumarate hydratase, class II [Ardenticatena maritima]
MTEYRIERDSLGEVRVPANALYGAQTQRAVENFPISGIRFPRVFIRALGLIKGAAAAVNYDLGLLDEERAKAIQQAAQEVAEGRWDEHFPIDIFQTGSGTSTNMNANEVIANRATQILGHEMGSKYVHPNDHVNMGQSSNDVIPTAIHVSAYLEVHEILLPGLRHLQSTLEKRAAELDDVVKTGRTHLMDAMPVRMSQEIGGWAYQVQQSIERIEQCLPRLAKLAIGGTAVGTGINAHPEFGARVAAKLAEMTGLPFVETDNHFAAQSAMDTATELSSHLKTAATALMKIANDLRWMNSGPIAGLAEITLPALQPGSSIMPGKINPVIPEAMMMVAAQVIGNDITIAIGNERGNFQLNVMLPVIAHNLLQSITILGNAARVLADKAVAGFTVNRERITSLVDRNPILVTALNPVIGYDLAAKIAKKAYAEGRSLKEVALEMTDLTPEQLEEILDPRKLTEGGIHK